ncbi:glycosyltransferase family 2 protein [Rhodococcus kroppenstedtii]|uniref:glycosyltransferase family 2 protein n=1 Tax=Rhodococcoides kroppenstedtii TaxID=293050 RepID=UPI001C9AF039|nr:glycosyltransferase family 2 protein [Rhodococcus kroppenstedtii]MBY6437537.1 glycosyltransferase family 2 protein [Rhodococcus kroppenstedtii]
MRIRGQNKDAEVARVCVVTAAYNAAATICESIESVQQQTLADWEMIVVSDCSTDGTDDLVRRYAAEDPRIRLLRQNTNIGAGACRNLAIASTNSTFVAILDADDIACRHRLERQVDELDDSQHLVATASQLLEFGDWGGPVLSAWPMTLAGIRSRQRKNKIPIPHPSTVFRRDALIAVGGYDVLCRRSEDHALFLKLRDAQVSCTPEPLVYYRTTRPIGLRYTIREGRYGRFAEDRVLRGMETPVPAKLPRTLAIDARSTIGWLRRRYRERSQSTVEVRGTYDSEPLLKDT